MASGRMAVIWSIILHYFLELLGSEGGLAMVVLTIIQHRHNLLLIFVSNLVSSFEVSLSPEGAVSRLTPRYCLYSLFHNNKASVCKIDRKQVWGKCKKQKESLYFCIYIYLYIHETVNERRDKNIDRYRNLNLIINRLFFFCTIVPSSSWHA